MAGTPNMQVRTCVWSVFLLVSIVVAAMSMPWKIVHPDESIELD